MLRVSAGTSRCSGFREMPGVPQRGGKKESESGRIDPSARRKRFGTNSQYLRHSDDVIPGIIEGAMAARQQVRTKFSVAHGPRRFYFKLQIAQSGLGHSSTKQVRSFFKGRWSAQKRATAGKARGQLAR
jgi:hypothetical protein